MTAPVPSSYAARQIEIGRAGLLLVLSLPPSSVHSSPYRRIDTLQRLMRDVLKIHRGIDTCRVRIRELHADGLARRETLPGRGLSYGWALTSIGIEACPVALAVLDPQQRSAYLAKAGRSPS